MLNTIQNIKISTTYIALKVMPLKSVLGMGLYASFVVLSERVPFTRKNAKTITMGQAHLKLFRSLSKFELIPGATKFHLSYIIIIAIQHYIKLCMAAIRVKLN